MRRFLRERDLKKHLKGKTSIEGNNNDQIENTLPLKEEKKVSELEEDLEKDSQLRHAVSLLSGWDVMVSSFKNKEYKNDSTHLTRDKTH